MSLRHNILPTITSAFFILIFLITRDERSLLRPVKIFLFTRNENQNRKIRDTTTMLDVIRILAHLLRNICDYCKIVFVRKQDFYKRDLFRKYSITRVTSVQKFKACFYFKEGAGMREEKSP